MKTLSNLLLVLMASVFLANTAPAQDAPGIDTRTIESLIETLDRDIQALHLLRTQFDTFCHIKQEPQQGGNRGHGARGTPLINPA